MEYAEKIAGTLDARVRDILQGKKVGTMFGQKKGVKRKPDKRLDDAKSAIRRCLRRTASTGATRTEIYQASKITRDLREEALTRMLQEGEVLRYKKLKMGPNGQLVKTGATVDVFVLEEFAEDFES